MEVVKNLFGAKAQFVSSVNGRVLKASKLYNNPMSLLVFQKLVHAYAIRKHKKSVPFLAGGVYHGCKNAGSHARDSLFIKDGTSKNKWNKVDGFRAFSLVTNKVFVSPRTMATHLYKFMGYGAVGDNVPLRELKQQITLWKGANKMPYIEVKDVYGGEVGVGVEGGGGSANKKLTKQAFTDPMRKLTTSLESLHDALKDENCDLASKRLTKDVTGAFNNIVQLVSFNGRPSYGSDDDNDEEEEWEDESSEASEENDANEIAKKSEVGGEDESSESSESSSSDDNDSEAAKQSKVGDGDASSDGSSDGNGTTNVNNSQDSDKWPTNN